MRVCIYCSVRLEIGRLDLPMLLLAPTLRWLIVNSQCCHDYCRRLKMELGLLIVRPPPPCERRAITPFRLRRNHSASQSHTEVEEGRAKDFPISRMTSQEGLGLEGGTCCCFGAGAVDSQTEWLETDIELLRAVRVEDELRRHFHFQDDNACN